MRAPNRPKVTLETVSLLAVLNMLSRYQEKLRKKEGWGWGGGGGGGKNDRIYVKKKRKKME